MWHKSTIVVKIRILYSRVLLISPKKYVEQSKINKELKITTFFRPNLLRDKFLSRND